MMIQGIIALILAIGLTGTGYLVGKWHTRSSFLPVVEAQVQARDGVIVQLDGKLGEVIAKASESAELTSRQLDEIQSTFRERSLGLELLAKRTEELKDAFDTLQPSGCVFPPEYQRLLDDATDSANTGRDRLYTRPGNRSN